MRGNAYLVCCFAASLFGIMARPAPAQQEFYHPGETYDSLQAGHDAHMRRRGPASGPVGRQIMIENQIIQQNTWADPQDRYRPVHPESYGPVMPKAYGGPTLADVYAYPTDGGPVFYGGTPAPTPTTGGSPVPPAASYRNTYAATVPVFQPWPRVPNDIWGAPYYGYVQQPIGHVKIWTSRLGYIYKPIYASPADGEPAAGFGRSQAGALGCGSAAAGVAAGVTTGRHRIAQFAAAPAETGGEARFGPAQAESAQGRTGALIVIYSGK